MTVASSQALQVRFFPFAMIDDRPFTAMTESLVHFNFFSSPFKVNILVFLPLRNCRPAYRFADAIHGQSEVRPPVRPSNRRMSSAVTCTVHAMAMPHAMKTEWGLQECRCSQMGLRPMRSQRRNLCCPTSVAGKGRKPEFDYGVPFCRDGDDDADSPSRH